jgi:hypothetical protein
MNTEKSVIVVGHADHGRTALTRALEEKERGITSVEENKPFVEPTMIIKAPPLVTVVDQYPKSGKEARRERRKKERKKKKF